MAKVKEKPEKVHVKRNDQVIVLAGKSKGKTGKVLKVLPDKGQVIVEGVNVAKRHTKPRPPQVPRGGIIEKAMPINASNVMLKCPKCDKPVRAKNEKTSDGKKIRVCRKCGDQIVSSSEK